MAASRFEKYRVARGDDIGDPDYWNRRLRDVDTRLVTVEGQKDTLDAVIEEGRTVFRTRVDEILVPLVQEVEAIADLGALLRAHSASEVEITTGGKTFFVDEADRRRFAAPGYLSIVAVGNPSLAMSGRLVSYSEATGELVIDVDQVDGSGWGADWSISVGNTTDAAGDAAEARAARDATLGYRTQVEQFTLTASSAADTATARAGQAVEANSGAQAAKQAAVDAATVSVARAGEAEQASASATSASQSSAADAAAAAASYGTAAAKATLASDKADVATSAAGTATTQAGIATSAAGTATTAANTATTKATEAAAARDTTVTAKNDTIAAINSWTSAVLPPAAVDPATRPGGGALQVGDQFFKTSDAKWRTWSGTQWTVNAVPLGSEVASVFGRSGSVSAQAGDYRADQISRTAGQQTVVAGADVEAALEGLNTALGGKAATSHTHVIGDVTGLQTALNGKAAATHTHVIGDVTGLQGALDAKLDDSQATATGLAVLGAVDAAAVRTAAGLGSFATRSSILGSEVGRSAAEQAVIAGATVEAALQGVASTAATAVTNEATARANADGLKVDKTVTVTGAGLATGGGALSANQTITVTKSTSAQATAGTDDTTAMTPIRVKDAVAALVPAASTTVVGKARFATTTEAIAGTAVDIAITPADLKVATDAVYTRIVGAAPEALNQIAEISASINNDANFAVTVSGQIAVKLDTSATSAWARGGFINAADAATARTYLGLGSAATQASTAFAAAAHAHAIGDVTGLQTALDAKLASASYTASDVLTKLKTVDGNGSGLDADVVRGTTPTTFGLARLSDADAASARGGLGLGTAAVLPAGGSAGNVVVRDAAGLTPAINGSAVVSAAGASVDFTGIPSTAQRLVVMFAGVTTTGSAVPLIQLGSGAPQTSGYVGSIAGMSNAASPSTASPTTGFGIYSTSGANVLHGQMTLTHMGNNVWTSEHQFSLPTGAVLLVGSGSVYLGGALDRLRVTTTGGGDTFDGGNIKLTWEA